MSKFEDLQKKQSHFRKLYLDNRNDCYNASRNFFQRFIKHLEIPEVATKIEHLKEKNGEYWDTKVTIKIAENKEGVHPKDYIAFKIGYKKNNKGNSYKILGNTYVASMPELSIFTDIEKKLNEVYSDDDAVFYDTDIVRDMD